jgi:hypothetical protein
MSGLRVLVAIVLAAVAGLPAVAATPQSRNDAFTEASSQASQATVDYPDYTLIFAPSDSALTRYYFSKASNPAYPAWIRIKHLLNGQTENTISCDSCEKNITAVNAWPHDIANSRDDVFTDAMFQAGRTVAEHSDYTLITTASADVLTRYYFSKISHSAYPVWMMIQISDTGHVSQTYGCDDCANTIAPPNTWNDALSRSREDIARLVNCDPGHYQVSANAWENGVANQRSSILADKMYKRRITAEYPDYTTLTDASDYGVTRYYLSKPTHPAYPGLISLRISFAGKMLQTMSFDACSMDQKSIDEWMAEVGSDFGTLNKVTAEFRANR